MLQFERFPDRFADRRLSLPLPGQGWTGAVRFLLRAIFCLVLGAMLGLVLTERSLRLEGGIGAVQIGAWSFFPDAGTADINPYLRARFARTGQVPMSSAEGVMFTATRDSRGDVLDRSCTYRVTGSLPPARFWTLDVSGTEGFSLPNPAQRSGYTAAEVLRSADGDFIITVSPFPEPGNWVPVRGFGRFVLALRLYDTAVTALGTRSLRDLPMPSITRDRCA